MKDLDEHGRMCEEAFGMISGFCIYELHALSTAAGSKWDMSNPTTMEIIVNRSNAEAIYGWCREVHCGYNIGLDRHALKLIKAARKEAHAYLYEEANSPETSIERKIQLVKLTSKR